ncbi:MAG: 50S ribosomal protein L24 [Candidatus Binatia bacterium]|nr:50S ribosomal protein L24 [Deltaproteobacteria bacterium]
MALKLRKNDNVMIIAGKERGTTGKILKVLSEKDRAIIERLNLVKRHTKPRGPQQPGGILEKEASIHISNLMLMCDRCNAPIRFGHKVLGDGKKVRICRRCGETID